jgi:glycerol-1-phosphate dehydrogenase [NAD(P)+]
MLGRRWRCACGQEHAVPTRELIVRPGALDELPAALERHSLRGRLLLLADPTTYEVAGRRVEKLLQVAGHFVDTLILHGEHGDLKATDAIADQPLAALRDDTAALLAVGAGTINDLTKYTAHRAGRPYVTIPTAASMNGFTSHIVALVVRGVKRTLPAAPPLLAVADTEIIRRAPAAMTRAGLADILAKPVATADWMLDHVLHGAHYCPEPYRLLEGLEPRYLSRPAALAAGDSDAVAALTEALLWSGISMTIAGSSSPASGGEHLISHLLDMQALLGGAPANLHGAQVGLGTLFSARLYEMLLALDAPRPPAWQPIEAYAADLDAFGPLAGEVRAEFAGKLKPAAAYARYAADLTGRWAEITGAVHPFLRPAAALRDVLRRAGAPTRPAELAITPAHFRDVAARARYIRARYTVLDLAADAGVLPARLDEALAVFAG